MDLFRSRSTTFRVGAGLLSTLVLSTVAAAYTPDSSAVQAMLDKAKQFLAAKEDQRPGGKALVALVFLKDGEFDHPRVKDAEEGCVAFGNRSIDELASEAELYSVCLTCIFLCELDAVKYRPQIDNLLGAIWRRQRDHGGFGYATKEDGDTSMTQYVVLAAWTAHQKKIPLKWDAIQEVLGWLIRTQDPSGAWGYQGKDPGQTGARVPQSEVRLSLAAGGLGSVYICADLLGAGERLKSVSTEEAKLPAAFEPVVEEQDREAARQRGSMAPAMLTHVKRSMIDGNEYFQKEFKIPYGQYDHYYIYALERYKSFREQIDKGPDPNPDWYDRGVKWLAETQGDDGGWKGSDVVGPTDTAFAALFLMRSTKKSIAASLGQGLLTGGRGLPTDTTNIRIRRGKIVAQPLTASPEEIMSIMEDPEHPDFAALADNPESVLLSVDPGKRTGELQRLRRLVQSGSSDARRLAVKALARHRDFDNVPVLIFALGDQDAAVVKEARDALRFISRKFGGFGMPDYPSEAQQQAGIAGWKNWYRSIRPDAKLLD